jgi:hypothetical protein
MSNLFEAFEIELPASVDHGALTDLEQALGEIEGVDQCGKSTTRSLDPAGLMVWVTLVSSVVSAAGGAVPVVKLILDLFRRKGIKGAKLKLADGSVLEFDEISGDDLQRLVQRTKRGN